MISNLCTVIEDICMTF